MKAIITTKFGGPDVLQLKEIPIPACKNNEILVKVIATPVTSGDCRARSLRLTGVPLPARIMARLVLGFTKPRKPVQGLWLSGIISETGEKVQGFKPGDAVVARTPDLRFGAYAEYAAVPASGPIVLKPENLTHEEAVAIPFGGITAMYFLSKVKITRGSRVLIYGASGATGSSAVQIAKYLGAEVTAVCSGRNESLVKALGADQVIDYTREDFTKREDRYDVIFDCVGKITSKDYRNVLQTNGIFLSVLSSGHAVPSKKSLQEVMDLAISAVLKPVIDRIYKFTEMKDAHQYVEEGHKQGNVVVISKEE